MFEKNNKWKVPLIGMMAGTLLFAFTVPSAAAETETKVAGSESEAQSEFQSKLLAYQMLTEGIKCSYERRGTTDWTVYCAEIELTNTSDEEIMEIETVLRFYDDQGTELDSVREVYNGQDTPVAPGESVLFEAMGAIEYPKAPASCEVEAVKVYTAEEKPPSHLPQEGELLYMELSEPHLEHITTEMPVKIELWIDRMGARSEAVVKEKETISRLVTAFSKIKIGKESMEFVTDNYNGMIFTFEDGTEIYLGLNLKNLEYQVYNGTRVYELEQFDEFWGWMNDLTETEDR